MGCSSTKKQGCLLGWTASWTERWIFSSSRSSSSMLVVVVCMVVKWTICSIRLLSWPHTERVEKWCFRFQYSRLLAENQDQLQLPHTAQKKICRGPKTRPQGENPVVAGDELRDKNTNNIPAGAHQTNSNNVRVISSCVDAQNIFLFRTLFYVYLYIFWWWWVFFIHLYAACFHF